MGETLTEICGDERFPDRRSVYRWLLNSEHKEFRLAYARARELQADCFADEILDIADDGRNDKYLDKDGNELTDHDHIARSRLRVDSRKWLASKLAPKNYGDKLTQEVTGANGEPLSITVKFD